MSWDAVEFRFVLRFSSWFCATEARKKVRLSFLYLSLFVSHLWWELKRDIHVQNLVWKQVIERTEIRGQSDDNHPMDDNMHLHVADLVSKDSVVTIAAMRMMSMIIIYSNFFVLDLLFWTLTKLMLMEVFTSRNYVLTENCFFRDNLIDMTYKTSTTGCLFCISQHNALCLFWEKGRGRKKVSQFPMELH